MDRYGPTVNMFSPLVFSECEAIGAVAGDENTAVLLTTRVRKLEKPLICVFLAAACRIVAELDRTLACSWLDTLST